MTGVEGGEGRSKWSSKDPPSEGTRVEVLEVREGGPWWEGLVYEGESYTMSSISSILGEDRSFWGLRRVRSGRDRRWEWKEDILRGRLFVDVCWHNHENVLVVIMLCNAKGFGIC